MHLDEARIFHYAITRSESNDKNAINSLVTTKGQRKDY